MAGKYSVLVLLTGLILLCAGCGHHMDNILSVNVRYAAGGPDSSEDPGIELSRILSEDGMQTAAGIVQQPVAVPVDGNSKRLLQWGILRRPEHASPQADPGAPALLAKYGAVYIGDTTKKTVYFTFDEGYENGYTPMILNTLKRCEVKAAFFITGPYLSSHEPLVRRMVEEGHVVGNHTVHHPSLPTISDREVEEEVLGLDKAYFELYGNHMMFFRPPKGEYSEHTLSMLKNLGYTTMFWSFAYEDWHRDRTRGTAYAHDMVMKNIHNGAVLLLHAVSSDNAGALESIIKDVRTAGYQIGDPMELSTSARKTEVTEQDAR